jgi:hypothetical protein
MLQIKSLFKSRRVRVTLALVAIGIAVVLSFLAPIKEQDPDIGLIVNPPTPTVSITNPVGTLMVNRSVDFRGILLTVTKVEEARAFSDDNKHAGTYTVRVQAHIQPGASVQSPVGVDYASLVRLALPGGQTVAPKLISLLAVVLPSQPEDGYFDFPVSTQVSLSSLTLRLGSNTAVAFGG